MSRISEIYSSSSNDIFEDQAIEYGPNCYIALASIRNTFDDAIFKDIIYALAIINFRYILKRIIIFSKNRINVEK